MRLGRALLIRAVHAESVNAIAERAHLSKQCVSAFANGTRICPNVDTAIALFDAAAIPMESWGRKFEGVALTKSPLGDAGHGTPNEHEYLESDGRAVPVCAEQPQEHREREGVGERRARRQG